MQVSEQITGKYVYLMYDLVGNGISEIVKMDIGFIPHGSPLK